MIPTDLLDTKIINNQHELDRMPYVLPQARGGGSLKISSLVKPLAQQIVSQLAVLRKSISATNHLKIAPTLVLVSLQAILCTKLVGDLCILDLHILGPSHQGLKVEICGVKASKFGA